MTENNGVADRSKHIDIKFHFNRETVERKIVRLQYCPREEMYQAPWIQSNSRKFVKKLFCC